MFRTFVTPVYLPIPSPYVRTLGIRCMALPNIPNVADGVRIQDLLHYYIQQAS